METSAIIKPKRARKVKKPVVEAPVFKIVKGDFWISFGREVAGVFAPLETPQN